MKTKRNTKQKEMILDIVKCSHTHPSAEEVYRQVHEKIPSVSLSTVYRNLQEMADSSLIDRIVGEDGITRFDGKCDHHYHFICNSCHKIIDLDIAYDGNINQMIDKDLKVDSHEIVFKGLCDKCINHSKEI